MQRFLINEKQQISDLVKSLILVFEKYQTKAYDTIDSLTKLLNQTTSVYKKLGRLNRESQIESLKAEVLTAQRGINPYTLVKQLTHRNELIQMVCFKILQTLESYFGTDISEIEKTLEGAKELIIQISIAAIQQNLISIDEISNLTSVEQSQAIWLRISVDERIALGQNRVRFLISKIDASLLFDEVIKSLN